MAIQAQHPIPEVLTARQLAAAPAALAALEQLYALAKDAGLPDHLNSMRQARAALELAQGERR